MRYGPQRRFEATLADLKVRLTSHSQDAHGSIRPNPNCSACNELLQEIEAKNKVLHKTTDI